MPHLSRTDLDAFARRLQERRRALIAEIRQEIEDGDDEHSVALRDQFDSLDPHDDRAVSDWVRDVGIARWRCAASPTNRTENASIAARRSRARGSRPARPPCAASRVSSASKPGRESRGRRCEPVTTRRV